MPELNILSQNNDYLSEEERVLLEIRDHVVTKFETIYYGITD